MGLKMIKSKLKKSLLLALKISLIFALESCSSLSSIDKPVCVEISIDRGFCTTIISGKDQRVDETNKLNGKTWFQMRPEMVMVPIETWAALKTYLIMNCKRSKACNRNIDSWNRSIQTIDDELLKKIPEAP